MPSKKTEKKTKTKPKSKKLTPTEKLNEKIDILKAESEIQNDRYLRLKAEFDNYRRRKEKEFIEIIKKCRKSIKKMIRGERKEVKKGKTLISNKILRSFI